MCAWLPSCTDGPFASLGSEILQGPRSPSHANIWCPWLRLLFLLNTVWMPNLLSSTNSFRTGLSRKEREGQRRGREGRGMLVKRKKRTGRGTWLLKFSLFQYLFVIATDVPYRCFTVSISKTAPISSLVKSLPSSLSCSNDGNTNSVFFLEDNLAIWLKSHKKSCISLMSNYSFRNLY